MPSVRLDRDYLTTVVAVLGTTISPYPFFWQARRSRGRPSRTDAADPEKDAGASRRRAEPDPCRHAGRRSNLELHRLEPS